MDHEKVAAILREVLGATHDTTCSSLEPTDDHHLYMMNHPERCDCDTQAALRWLLEKIKG